MKREEFVLPAPGIISPGDWEIMPSSTFGGQACSSRTERKMITGLSDNPHDAYLRRHEMAHVAISPADPASALKKVPRGKRPSMDSVLACEDARVTAYLGKVLGRKATEDPDWPHERRVEKIMQAWNKGNRRGAVLLATCTGMEGGDFPDPHLAGYLHSLRAKVGPPSTWSGPRGFRWTIEAAKFVDDIFTPPPPTARTGAEEYEEGDFDTGCGAHEHTWLVPEVQSLPLTATLPDTREDIASDLGTELGDIERMLLDRKVFTRKALAARSGSCLIDGSGSMSHSYERLEDVLKQRPDAAVGVYSGSDLFLVARGGKYSPPDKWIRRLQGSNASDLPSLEWLAKQKEPRTYISDLGVTMLCSKSGECFSPQATEQVLTFCKANRIEIFEDVESALKAGTE